MPDKENSDGVLEATILSGLNHSRIPCFIEIFSYDEVAYLVQEFIEGYPLSYYIIQGRVFSEKEIKKIIFQLLEIIQYLHDHLTNKPPVIHRDLRLSNIFWSDDGIYLIDFGCARYLTGCGYNVTSTLNENGVVSGHHQPGKNTYTLLREEISPRSDLFGTGVVGLDLFTTWVKDESLFNKPWQEVFPGGSFLKNFIERLLITEKQFQSAEDALISFKAN